MSADGGEEAGADPGYPIQAIETSEWSVGFTIGNDRARQRQPDSRQAGDLRHTGTIEVDGLSGSERPIDREAGVTMGAGRAWGPASQQPGLAWRALRRDRSAAQPLAEDREAKQKQDGTAFGGHGER